MNSQSCKCIGNKTNNINKNKESMVKLISFV